MGSQLSTTTTMKFSPVWSQSMTYTLFTLFPILLFALVTLWKLKLNYDTDIFQLQDRLAKATLGLNKSSSLSLILDRKVKEEEKENRQLKEENLLMTNKTDALKERMGTVEARALNLTSKLLIKEMDLGLLKKEKIRLEQQVKQKTAPTLKEKKEKTINLGTLTKTDRKEPTLLRPVNNSVEEKSSSEKTDVKEQIVDKLLDIKKKQHQLETDKEEIVEKLVDIKKKQQELEEAKKDFFSDTVADDSEQVESQNKVNTDKSENAIAEPANAVIRNDSVGVNSKTEIGKEPATLNVDQDDIQSLIKLPEASNQTQQQVLPTSPIPGGGSRRLHQVFHWLHRRPIR